MTLTAIVLLVLALNVVQLFLQETSAQGFDPAKLLGTRDVPPDLSVRAARLARAKDNLREALPLFLGLAMLAFAAGRPERAAAGATLFLVARVLYVPAYVFNLVGLRTLLWLVAFACTLALYLL